jgi:D-amino-acid dehydrogenase
MRICVIGAGVVGVTSAYVLARQGHEVVLVDARREPAEETSHANGGQLSFSYVAPLAAPGVLADMPSWLLRTDSPLRFRPRLDPHQWRWCLEFLLACRASVARRTTAQMLALSFFSRDVLHELLRQEPLEFGHVRNGKLIVYRSAALLEKARGWVQYQAGQGADQRILSADEVVEREPALAGMRGRMAGAVYTPGEEVGDCRAFTRGLFERFNAMPNGSALMGERVGALRLGGGHADRRIVAVEASGGDIQADHFVVAAGMGSRPLLATAGVDVPLYPLKGYSLSVPLDAAGAGTPAISVTDYERRIVYARVGGVLRMAAMVDMGGDESMPRRDGAITGMDSAASGAGRGYPEARIDEARIALIKQQVREVFPALPLEQAVPWAGLRPATPTGKPVIGRSRAASNLWLNLGQGALGFTLACGSAVLLAAQMAGVSTPVDAAPFAPRG